MFPDVTKWVQMFSDVFRSSQDALNCSELFFRHSRVCSRCVQMFSTAQRCFQMIRVVLGCSPDVL